MKPSPPPNTQGRAGRKHGGDQGHPEEAERTKKGPERGGGRKRRRPRKAGGGRRKRGTQTAQGNRGRRGGWRNGRGSAAARPTLTRDCQGGASGQGPDADSQRQPDKEVTTPRGAEGEKRHRRQRRGGGLRIPRGDTNRAVEDKVTGTVRRMTFERDRAEERNERNDGLHSTAMRHKRDG